VRGLLLNKNLFRFEFEYKFHGRPLRLFAMQSRLNGLIEDHKRRLERPYSYERPVNPRQTLEDFKALQSAAYFVNAAGALDLNQVALELEQLAEKLEACEPVKKPLPATLRHPNIELDLLINQSLEDNGQLEKNLHLYSSMNNNTIQGEFRSIQHPLREDENNIARFGNPEWVHEVFQKCQRYLSTV